MLTEQELKEIRERAEKAKDYTATYKGLARDKKLNYARGLIQQGCEDIPVLIAHIDELTAERVKSCRGCASEANAGVSGYCRNCIRLAVDRYEKKED